MLEHSDKNVHIFPGVKMYFTFFLNVQLMNTSEIFYF